MRRRVFYFASITTEALNKHFGANLFIGPAPNKVMAVCRALQSAQVSAIIVSSYLPVPIISRWQFRRNFRQKGVSFVQLFTLGRGVVKRFLSFVSYAGYAAIAVRTTDKVLFYNYFPEYILAAIILALRNNRAVIDIEDAPRKDEAGLRGLVNRWSFAVLRRLCEPRCITVSRAIGPLCGYERALPIYGVSTYFQTLSSTRVRRDSLAVLFGGAIIQETGLAVFISCVRQLADQSPNVSVEFHVTGRYDRTLFETLKDDVEQRSNIRIFLWGDMSNADYNSLLDSMDVGLCLKLPEHSMGQTTFPSKVIEYASFGMLVCSTPVSDVPFLFDDKTAVVLTSSTGEELANTIVSISKNRRFYEMIALQGQRMAADRFSSIAVGRAVRDLVFNSL